MLKGSRNLKKAVTKTCLNCLRSFVIRKHGNKPIQRLCSVSCFHEWQRKGNYRNENAARWEGGSLKRSCIICGQEFFRCKSDVAKGRAKFCSKKCVGLWLKGNESISHTRKKDQHGSNNPNWRGGKITKTCLVCEKEFKVKIAREKRGLVRVCSPSCRGVWTIKHRTQKKKHTGIEIKVEQYLKKLGIVFESQKVIPEGRTVADFFIPEQRLVIYADGKYWHNLPGAKIREGKQGFLLGMNGYKVLRLGEAEINNGKFSRKIIKEIN